MFNNKKFLKRTTPVEVTELKENEIFVFGSNEIGVHGAGAARVAMDKFDAVYGAGVGLTGQCYALPSKDKKIKTLPIEKIRVYVILFLRFAKANPDKIFLVTPIGCGLAGYTEEEIAPLFIDAITIHNIHLPESFWKVLLTQSKQSFNE